MFKYTMSTKDLIESNKDANTKKVFKEAEDTIRKITQLHLNNPKIKVELDYWDWEDEVLGEQDKGDPDGYLYCWVDDETKSDEEIDDIIGKKGEAWSDRLAEVFQDKNNKKKVTKEFQKYIDCEGDYSGAGYAIILNGKRAY